MTPGIVLPVLLLAGVQVGETPPPVAPTIEAAGQPGPVAPVLTAAADASPVVGARRSRHTAGDPLEGFNRDMFGVHQRFDSAIFRPAGMGYKRVVPKPVRSGLRHFFANLNEPIVFLNYLLQLKPGKAIETLARFSINSTLGFAGMLDIAKLPGISLPHRNNGLGNTLGYYGVKPGPYIFLPLVGPTTLRDFLGGQSDGFVLPLAIGKPFDRVEYQVPKAVLTGLDLRAESDDELKALFDGAVDPYATLRSAYLQSRQGEIDALHGRAGKGAPAELGDDLVDPAAGQGSSPVAPELIDPLPDPAAPSVKTPVKEAAPSELSDPLADPGAPNPRAR